MSRPFAAAWADALKIRSRSPPPATALQSRLNVRRAGGGAIDDCYFMQRMVASETRDSLTELRRGVLEFCVLAILRTGESYGFDIVRELSAGELLTSEGTIYPLLSRLRRQQWVTTTWRESDSGPPRRYYRITDRGRRALAAFAVDWTRFRGAVDGLLAGEAEEGEGEGGRNGR